MTIFSDTGILVRLFEPSDQLHTVVDAAVDVLVRRGEKLVTAHQNIAEFWNVCTRPKTARGGLGLDVKTTERRLQAVERTFAILSESTSFYPIWRQLVITHAVLGKQVHDARLVAVMMDQGLSHLLTLNGPDFVRYPGVIILDPVQITAVPPTP